METLLKSEIFFFISAVAVVILTAACLVAVYYIIQIVKDIKFIADKAKTESKHISRDIERYSKNLREGEKEIKSFAKTVKRMVK